MDTSQADKLLAPPDDLGYLFLFHGQLIAHREQFEARGLNDAYHSISKAVTDHINLLISIQAQQINLELPK